MASPTDTDPPSSPIWTQDPVQAVGGAVSNVDVDAVAGETLTTNQVVYLSDGTGGLTAGRWYLADADNTYSSSLAIAIGFATAPIATGSSGTVRRGGQITGLSGLTAGSYYYVSATGGAITTTAPTNNRLVGQATTTTTLVMASSENQANTTFPGNVSIGTQTFKGVKSVLGGTATTLPGIIGGVYFTDVVEHSVIASSTDSVMTSTTIPANMLNADGKAVRISFGTSTAFTGGNSHVIELEVGGTQIALVSTTVAVRYWIEAIIIRIDSDSVDVVGRSIQPSIVLESSINRINALDFTSAITIKTLGTTGVASTVSQTFFAAEMWG
jgi:hypothetical protein